MRSDPRLFKAEVIEVEDPYSDAIMREALEEVEMSGSDTDEPLLLAAIKRAVTGPLKLEFTKPPNPEIPLPTGFSINCKPNRLLLARPHGRKLRVASSKKDLFSYRHLAVEVEDMMSLLIMPGCQIRPVKLSAFKSESLQESAPLPQVASES